MLVLRCGLMSMTLLALAPALHAQPSLPDEHLRTLYLKSAEEKAYTDSTLAAVQNRLAIDPDDPLANAYRGAALVMRARYAFWPKKKLRYLRDGLGILDAQTSAHPRNAEIRYLRLISCYYLPRFLRRSWSVDEDMHALSGNLRQLRPLFDPEFYTDLVGFVMAYDGLTDSERADLAGELRWSPDAHYSNGK